ncbi:MAG: molybdopterin guanine dinucleotide-containing S/N-oxide reductase [Alphaproteobacteria bacterium]|nr:molybdopterin guanine dinucleotide-containing S/N-oxide reductase [Alphaproteobacteria bacterium]
MASVARTITGSHWGVYGAVVRDGRLVATEPFPKDTDPSALIGAMPGVVYDRTRIAQPMVRAGWLRDGIAGDRSRRGAEPFVPVSWDRALDLVAAELARVKAAFGNDAIMGGSYGWASAGRLHNARTLTHRFLNGFGGCVHQSGNYSFGAAIVLLPHVLGTAQPAAGQLTAWESIFESTRLLVAFGGLAVKNMQIEMGGVGEHEGVWRMRRLAEAGVEVVNIGPIREDVDARVGPTWLPIRPNTDTALMLALAHTLVAENRHDRDFIARYTAGFERFRPYLMGESDGTPKDADWAAAICEIPAETIRALARRMAATRTMISVSWSIQRADHGEQPYWMAIVLAALLGQIGLPGGGFGFGYGASGGNGRGRLNVPQPTLATGPNPTGAIIPVSRIADALLEPGGAYDFNGKTQTYPDIRLVYWAGGNPFHHHQDLNKLLRAWARPETIVAHEPFWTPLARHADIVLPATTTLERNDIGAGGRDRYLYAMKKAIEPVGAARNDFDIYAALATRLGFADAFTEGRDEMGWLRHLYDVARQQAAEHQIEMPDFDAFWEAGHIEFPRPATHPVLFADYRAAPEAKPLNTPSGRIEIFSDKIAAFGYDDCGGHPMWFEPAEWLGGATAARYGLHLVSNQPATRLHSQMDNAAVSRASKIKGREPVLINPADAASRGIADGDIVRLYNDRGACLAGAVVTDRIRPGVLQLSTGAWYDPASPGVVGTLDRHGNPNVLTIDKGTSKLAQAPIAQTVLVEIERYDGAPPPLAIADPPATTTA